jgi:hypothetical protein
MRPLVLSYVRDEASKEGIRMFTPMQYREKAIEYGKRMKLANGPNERREFRALEQSFAVLADNAQWLVDNHHRTVRRTAFDQVGKPG